MTLFFYLALMAYLLVSMAEFGLTFLNLRHLRRHGATIPEGFQGVIDSEVLIRTRDYVLDKNRLGNYAELTDHAIVLGFVFGGGLDLYNHWVHGLALPFVASGAVFFLGLVAMQTLLGLPFSWAQTFRIEAKYGFNTSTPRLWIADAVKNLGLVLILNGLAAAAGLWLIRRFPGTWWVWVWFFFMGFTLFIMVLSPYVLEPLFNKFTPIDETELAGEIKTMMRKAGLEAGRVFKMDASRRSRHSNAYFSGIGKVKRIILYDTLLQTLEPPEILSVLAHEVGHWKKRHILKRLLATQLISLAVLFVFDRMMYSEFLVRLFRIQDNTLAVQIILFFFMFSILIFPLTPWFRALSRRQEQEADQYAISLTGKPEHLIGALVKMSKDNLANLHPHPWYAAFHYAHPPVVRRIAQLKAMGNTPGNSGKE